MKEQILSLEQNDDLHSLRDKIARAQAGRLVLHWPALEEPITRRLDLELMRRWAAMAGSDLAIVSPDPAVHQLAGEAGIPCYFTLTESALAGISPRPSHPLPWQDSSRRRRSPPAPPPRMPARTIPLTGRIAIFAIAVLSVAVTLGLLIPSARIRVVFPSRTIHVSGIFNPSLCGELSTRLELSGRRAATGSVFAPTAYAKGTVVLTNISTRLLNLPAGLRISSRSGISFETVTGVVLPSGQSKGVEVRAVLAGPSGNLPSETLNVVEGPLSLLLQATNPEPTTGGAGEWRGAVAEADTELLRADLEEEVMQEAETGLANLAGSGKVIAEKTLTVIFDPSDEPDLPVGSAADSVGLTLHATASALGCPKDLVVSQALELLSGNLHSGETVFAATVTVRLEKKDPDGLLLEASGLAADIPDRFAMASALRGRTSRQAADILRDRFQAREVLAVEQSPGCIPFLPLFAFQIEIIPDL
jgi:hypothetical protein